MIIEFVGTPGAGKTTLLPAVADFFDARGFNARSVVEAARPFAERTWLGKAVALLAPPNLRRPLLWQVFYHLSTLYQARFFARNWRLMRTVLPFQSRRPLSRADRRHVLFWFLRLTGYYEFLKAHAGPEDVLLFDEGFVHRVVQLFASAAEEPDPHRIAVYLDLLPRPDLVIFPYAPWRTCEKRVYDRGIWERFRQRSPAEVSRYIANAHAIVDLAVAHMRAGGWTVISVDNGGDDPAVAKIALQRELSRLVLCHGAFDGGHAEPQRSISCCHEEIPSQGSGQALRFAQDDRFDRQKRV